jgi:hypothetical protein
VEGKLRWMRSSESSNEGWKEIPKDGSARLPEGYSIEAEGPNLLLLRRADGSVVAAFAFSAFGPTPETMREAAEEDLRSLRRGWRGSGGRGGRERGEG